MIPRSGFGSWACAVFAYNEARTIEACLESLKAAAGDSPGPVKIYVLANGCTDNTVAVVNRYAREHTDVECISLALADKAAAWNHYIHQLAPEVDMHLMVDGDVQACSGAVPAIAARFRNESCARAVAAQPSSGRSQAAWSGNMVRYGRIAGCLYALRGDFVGDLRAQGTLIPEGLIGEDLFLSTVVKDKLTPQGLFQPDSRLAVEPAAQFEFRSLSYLRPGDWVAYARRLVRYRIRDYQLMLLLNHLQVNGDASLPATMREVYVAAGVKPQYRWRGRRTPVEWLAVALLRAQIESARR